MYPNALTVLYGDYPTNPSEGLFVYRGSIPTPEPFQHTAVPPAPRRLARAGGAARGAAQADGLPGGPEDSRRLRPVRAGFGGVHGGSAVRRDCAGLRGFGRGGLTSDPEAPSPKLYIKTTRT